MTLNRSEKDCKIQEKVLKLLCEQNVKSVFIYVSLGCEVDTRDIIANVFGKIDVFVPYTYDGKMVPVRLNNLDKLKCADKYGNVYLCNEPKENDYLRTDASNKYSIDLTITPMLAFNSELYRLGYGGGYYDKFFAACDTMKVGIVYDEQKIDDLKPEAHDVALDAIITQSAILRRHLNG